jgi:hypothetical protein
MFTTRFWGSAVMLLCTLLLQDCQLHSTRATEEEAPAVGSSSVSAMRQHASSEPQAMRSLTLYSAPPPAHVPPSRFSTTSVHRQSLSVAPSTLSTMGNSLVEPCDLPAAVALGASRAVPPGEEPGHALSPDDLWWSSIGGLDGLEEISIAETFLDEEEAALKQPAKRRSSDPEDDLANKKVRYRERPESDKAAELPAFWDPVAQHDQVFDDVEASLDTSYSPQIATQNTPQEQEQLQSKIDCKRKRQQLPFSPTPAEPFGASAWQRYFGEIGPAPDLPSDIDDILDNACPFWSGRKIRDTHLLVLIPVKVNGQPFSLDLLRDLIQRPKIGGHKTQYCCYDSDVQAQLGAASPQASYWLLMTRDVLPKSRNKTYADHKKLVADHARRTSFPYEVPKALEAATAILMHHVQNGERLYSDSPWTWTRCQELMLHPSSCPVVVGGFESSGLDVVDVNFGIYDNGVAGCRKFCVETVLRTTPANKQVSSFRSPSSAAPSTLATVDNFPAAPCDLPAAAMLTASRVVPLGDEPGHALFPDDLWWSSIGGLDGLEEISIAETFLDEEEASKQPAKRRSSDLEDDLVNKKVRHRERPESDKAAELPAFWDPVAQHDQTFDDVANALPDTFYSPQIATQKAPQEKKQEQLQSKIDCKRKRQQLPFFPTSAEPFGASAWQQYYGEVGPAPELPSNIDGILDSACPFWSGRKIRDTHLLVLIPATVDGAPFTLNLLKELIERPKNGGHRAQYRYYGDNIKAQLGAASPQASYWLLMTRDVLPESCSKKYAEQKKLVADHAKRTGLPYELFKALEAAAAILTHHVQNGERLYGDNPWTWTRCQELIVDPEEGEEYPAVVGGFEDSGLAVYNDSYDSRYISGAACCRKLF